MHVSQVFGTALNFAFEHGIAIGLSGPDKQGFQRPQLLAAGVIRVVARHFIRERVATRKGRSEDHAGVVAQSVREGPSIRQLRAFARCLVAHDQRNAGIAQGIDSHGDRQLGVAVESRLAVGGNAEFTFQIERTSASCQLDDIGHIVDGFECRSAIVALHQAGNVLVEHCLPQACGDEIDELIAAQDASEVRIVKDALGAGQTESRTCDDDWQVRRTMVSFTLNLPGALKNLGEEPAEFSEMIAIRLGAAC